MTLLYDQGNSLYLMNMASRLEETRWSGIKNLLIRGSPIIGDDFEPSEEVCLRCINFTS